MSFRSDALDEFIARLELKAYVLESCDTANDYREAQEYRKLIADLKVMGASSSTTGASK